MTRMPAIPESTKNSFTYRLRAHAKQHWPQLADLQVGPGGLNLPNWARRMLTTEAWYASSSVPGRPQGSTRTATLSRPSVH